MIKRLKQAAVVILPLLQFQILLNAVEHGKQVSRGNRVLLGSRSHRPQHRLVASASLERHNEPLAEALEFVP